MSSAQVYASSNVLLQPSSSANLSGKQARYPTMEISVIRVFSVIEIILGTASIAIQIPALVILATKVYYCVYFEADYVAHGIWAGVFYILAGSTAMATTNKRTKPLYFPIYLVSTVVFAAISIASSIAATVLSGMGGVNGYYYGERCSPYYCEVWFALEWTLFSLSVLAFVNSMVLTILLSPLLFSIKHSTNINVDQQLPKVNGSNRRVM